MVRELVLLWGTKIPENKNRTRYQRASYLSDNYKTHLVLFGNKVPEDIQRKMVSTNKCPGGNVVSKLLFPIWSLYVLFFGIEDPPDAVITSYHPPAIVVGFCWRIFGEIVIVDIWDDPMLTLKLNLSRAGLLYKANYLYYLLWYYPAMWLISKSDLLILSLHPDILKEFPFTNIQPGNVKFTTNGTDISIYDSIDLLETQSDKLQIIYVGSFQQERGIDTILDAFKEIVTKIDGAKLILVGEVPPNRKQDINRYLQTNGLTEHVDVMGRLSHEKTLRTIARSDIGLCIFPRERELEYIYPIKIFEYMALKSVPIATSLKGVSEIVGDEETGLLIPPEDPHALTECVMELDNNARLATIKKNAKNEVYRYDWEYINQQIGESIDSVLV